MLISAKWKQLMSFFFRLYNHAELALTETNYGENVKCLLEKCGQGFNFEGVLFFLRLWRVLLLIIISKVIFRIGRTKFDYFD